MRACRFSWWIVPVLLAIAAPAGMSAARAGDAPKPARKDTSPRLRPRDAEFTAAVVPAAAKPGETVSYRVTATIARPWHIYAYAETQPEEGPRSTQFDLFGTDGLKVVGAWTPATAPERRPESAFPNLPFVSFHEGRVTWSIPLLVPPGTPPGSKTIRSQIYFQLCDDRGCKPPTYWTVPEATLTVLPGGAVAPDRSSATSPVGPSPRGASTAPGSVVEQKISQGLMPFLLFAAGGGLLALAMPCVWPMVPVTVNFFIKQGHEKRGRTCGLAVTYCLSIVVIFTLVGVLFSAFLGASSLQRLANTAWLNLTVAAIFIIFGLSLLGLFELRLPSSLLNASAQSESRGGLAGVFFMALTLTITSFTCTFPVVGGLLVVAAGGSYLYPVLGLATFATVLAFPFFLLALTPGLLQRLPRSGDWMNTVKIVGGLVELGAAFKFLNTAEIALGATPDSAWFDVQVVLTIWVALALIAGLYLLGLFRTDHDLGEVRVGPLRILFGALFLGFSLYFAPALFGNPPQSRIYNLLVGLMPPDVGELGRPAAVGAGEGGDVKASSSDPKEAERQEAQFHGVRWGMSYEQALEQARAENKPILIDFTGVNCANCRQMEREVLPRAEIRDVLRQFVTVALYTDFVPIASLSPAQREELAEANRERQIDLVRDNTTPLYVVLSPDGKLVESPQGGYIPAARFKAYLEGALKKVEGNLKVAGSP